MDGRGHFWLVKSGKKRVLSRVCTAWRNSGGLKCYTEVVNATSALGSSARSSAEYVHRRMCTTHSQGNYGDSKGRSLVSKDTHAPRGSISVVASSQKKVEKVVRRGFAESLKASLFLAVSLSRVCLLFSRFLRFSAARTTPVRFEPRDSVPKTSAIDRRNLFDRCN